jgi:putative endonuclease
VAYNTSARQQIGANSEQLAQDYLQAEGLIFVACNFTCRMGEIDLIMRDKETLVFIEVRSRSQKDAYDPIESIHYGKQQRLARSAVFFLQKQGWLDTYPCRFDVIGITYTQGPAQINWIKHAFSL